VPTPLLLGLNKNYASQFKHSVYISDRVRKLAQTEIHKHMSD